MESDIGEIGAPLAQSAFWMKLLGVLMLIYGILSTIALVLMLIGSLAAFNFSMTGSIVGGIVFAGLIIWAGGLLFQSASAANQATRTGEKDALVRSLTKLKAYFTIMGIFALLSIITVTTIVITGGVGMLMVGVHGSGSL